MRSVTSRRELRKGMRDPVAKVAIDINVKE